ncbi:helix-turn-helix domain-containing protein [Streptomyces huiliensis]|uniref:helix-turn-helix domain-containing protein n=1 Tax=Streptomyces huiliensis TaxID=2876027 RepID=UPI001CC088C4|nr:helix-turn-helix domain-containing protein [Streptomyces huiliensis]MBZ4322137.1 helix-turn-helix domain-containing protein [Streptomyces huiliensis]
MSDAERERERRAFGARVAELRAARGLTQKELATRLGRTTSWLSQVERGIQPVNRLDVLNRLADGLGVPVAELRPDAPPTAEPAERPVGDGHLNRARLLLSGHPALGTLLSPPSPDAPHDAPHDAAPLAGLREDVEHVWSLAHGDRYAELGAALNSLLPSLERLARTAGKRERAMAYGLLARTYQALSAAFTRQNEADAAWVAADRSIAAAELSGRVLDVFAGTYRLAHACLRLRRYEQAEHVAQAAVDALGRHRDEAAATPEELSLLGSFHLVLALLHARRGDRTAARRETERARTVARRVGGDRNDFHLEFGPTNVEIQAVAVAVELGDAGEALDTGLRLDAGGLSVERRARLALDMGRAHAQLRRVDEAVRCFLAAERLAPEMVRGHEAARGAIRDLALVAGRGASAALRELAERVESPRSHPFADSWGTSPQTP